MTRGAQAHLDRKIKEKEIETNKKIADERLKDNQKQRDFEKGERRKDRVANVVTSFIKGIKLPVGKNDPNYYKKFVDKLDRFVNVPTYQRLGAESFATTKITHNNNVNGNMTVPGIMVLYHMPTIGPENGTLTSSYPINQSLNRDKEQILKLNSRSSVNYEGADIGLNIFCTAEIVTLLCEIRRALVIYQTYRGDNAYLAKHYISALRLNYADLDARVAEYRKRFNIAVRKFNSSIVAPADITLYARKIYLATNVFKDRTGEVKQVYMFKQVHFHTLNAVGDGTAIYDAMTPRTLNEYFTWLDYMMESITANPDYVEMYADMRHAIPNLLSLDPDISADEVVQFNDDTLNRAQIHNVRTLPYFGAIQNAAMSEINTTDWLLHIDTNGYLFQGSSVTVKRRINRTMVTGDTVDHLHNWRSMLKYVYSNESGARRLTLFDMDKDEINGDDILDITRFNIGSDTVGSAATATYMDVNECGTEVIWYCAMHTLNSDGSSTSVLFASDNLIMVPASPVVVDNAVSATTMYLLSKFDWAPHYYRYLCTGNSEVTSSIEDAVQVWTHIGDLDHSFSIGYSDLSSINEACVLSEFYISGTTFKQ